MSSPQFEFDFRTRAPTGHAGRFVESIWYARGTVPYAREKIAPTGSTVVVLILGDPIMVRSTADDIAPLVAERGFMVGPHDGPMVNEPLGETFAVGIVCKPVGCHPVFGVLPSEIRGTVSDVDRRWPDAVELRASLTDAPDPEFMLDEVEQRLGCLDRLALPGTDRCESAIDLIEAEPTRSIGEIARELGVSHGHLDRQFTRIVGLTPRSLARLIRVRRLLADVDVRGSIDWAGVAVELGWFDQAHLIRDFKRHIGVTPTEYMAAQQSAFSPVDAADAAGFVPEF